MSNRSVARRWSGVACAAARRRAGRRRAGRARGSRLRRPGDGRSSLRHRHAVDRAVQQRGRRPARRSAAPPRWRRPTPPRAPAARKGLVDGHEGGRSRCRRRAARITSWSAPAGAARPSDRCSSARARRNSACACACWRPRSRRPIRRAGASAGARASHCAGCRCCAPCRAGRAPGRSTSRRRGSWRSLRRRLAARSSSTRRAGRGRRSRLSTASYTPDQLTAPPTVPVSCSRPDLVARQAAPRSRPPPSCHCASGLTAARSASSTQPVSTGSASAARQHQAQHQPAIGQRRQRARRLALPPTDLSEPRSSASGMAQRRCRRQPRGAHRRAGQAVFDVLHRFRAIDVRHQHRQPAPSSPGCWRHVEGLRRWTSRRCARSRNLIPRWRSPRSSAARSAAKNAAAQLTLPHAAASRARAWCSFGCSTAQLGLGLQVTRPPFVLDQQGLSLPKAPSEGERWPPLRHGLRNRRLGEPRTDLAGARSAVLGQTMRRGSAACTRAACHGGFPAVQRHRRLETVERIRTAFPGVAGSPNTWRPAQHLQRAYSVEQRAAAWRVPFCQALTQRGDVDHARRAGAEGHVHRIGGRESSTGGALSPVLQSRTQHLGAACAGGLPGRGARRTGCPGAAPRCAPPPARRRTAPAALPARGAPTRQHFMRLGSDSAVVSASSSATTSRAMTRTCRLASLTPRASASSR